MQDAEKFHKICLEEKEKVKKIENDLDQAWNNHRLLSVLGSDVIFRKPNFTETFFNLVHINSAIKTKLEGSETEIADKQIRELSRQKSDELDNLRTERQAKEIVLLYFNKKINV